MSKKSTDVTIINQVNPVSNSITQIELDQLISIQPTKVVFSNDVKNVRTIIQQIVGIGKSGIPYETRVAGVYIFTNLRTGDMLVGSSINLAVRLINYITPKNIKKGVRLIFQDFRKFTIEDYDLAIYIIKNGYDQDTRDSVQHLTLALEQYYIFILNPSLNTVKVAGSPPYTEINPLVLKRIMEMSQANRMPTYVYKDNTLIYKTDSQKQLREESGLSNETIEDGLAGKIVFQSLTLSRSIIPNCNVNLIDTIEFIGFVKDLRLLFRKERLLFTIADKRIEYVNSKKISLKAIHLISGEVYKAESIRAISLLLKTLGPNMYVSPSTISTTLRSNTTTKYWKFHYSKEKLRYSIYGVRY